MDDSRKTRRGQAITGASHIFIMNNEVGENERKVFTETCTSNDAWESRGKSGAKKIKVQGQKANREEKKKGDIFPRVPTRGLPQDEETSGFSSRGAVRSLFRKRQRHRRKRRISQREQP